jgi:hypothetical protein
LLLFADLSLSSLLPEIWELPVVAPLDPRLPVVGAANRQEIGKLVTVLELHPGFLKMNSFHIYKLQIQPVSYVGIVA